MKGAARAGPERSAGERPIRKLFVANRGEVALRVIRAARELEIETATAASGADRDLPFASAAGELFPLPDSGEAYLDAGALVALAVKAGADALHPGYGFLSESAELARACDRAGLAFIGPPAGTLEAAGDKVEARLRAEKAGVPVLPGRPLPPDPSPDAIRTAAKEVGFPLLVKAASGGGGRGIRRAAGPEELSRIAPAASREAKAAFGDGRIYLEREVPSPRHVEVQILADARGGIALFPERDCSIQRRHQKVVEESPSPAVDPGLRERLGEAARRVAEAVGYRNAGTVEFLLEPGGRFYFIEVNARLQVEHPLTELVTGIDLVAWQLRIAAGEGLPADLTRAMAAPRGHAIECRICAERPPGFSPSDGRLEAFRAPAGPGIRFDTGYREKNTVETRFDSLLAKLIAWGPDRPAALRRLEGALAETVVLGIDTTVDFLGDLVRHPDFRAGRQAVDFIARTMAGWSPPPPPPEVIRIAGEVLARRGAGPGRGGAPARPYRGPWEAVGSMGAR